MKRILSLLVELVLFVGVGMAHISNVYYDKAQMADNPFSGRSYGSSQSGRQSVFDSRASEHIATPKQVYSSYTPMSVYSSSIENPFYYQEPTDEAVIKRVAPGEGTGTGVQQPLGDPIIPLLLMLAAYAVWKRRKTHASRSTSK